MVGAKMNASELADLIGMCGDGGYNQDAATMLRQQQAEIGALKQIIDANNLNQNIGQFVKPTNEPVAWMDDLSFFTEQPDDMDGVTPLYTHQYERPHNTVLVPCDKLAEMQAEIDVLKQQILMWENADVPTEVMAEVIIELEKRGFIEKTEKAQEK